MPAQHGRPTPPSEAEERPRPGDLVYYYRQRGEGGKLTARTGRVLTRHAWGVRVDATTAERNHRVEWPQLVGWWPKGTPDRSLENLRDVIA